ncbi:MAG: hypothetical protein K0B01_07995 [Syntrophobacterales bacterium]|nr:hypothetical protein [Syntrophobacterales bacterium]
MILEGRKGDLFSSKNNDKTRRTGRLRGRREAGGGASRQNPWPPPLIFFVRRTLRSDFFVPLTARWKKLDGDQEVGQDGKSINSIYPRSNAGQSKNNCPNNVQRCTPLPLHFVPHFKNDDTP